MQAMFSLQIVWNPKKIEPPDGVYHELANRKRPRLSATQELCPFDFLGQISLIALDVASFLAGAERMVFGGLIKPIPPNPARQPRARRSARMPIANRDVRRSRLRSAV